jgi:hypothetical protein
MVDVLEIDGVSVSIDSFLEGFLVRFKLFLLEFFDHEFDIFFLLLVFVFDFSKFFVGLLDKLLSLMFFLFKLIEMLLDELLFLFDDFLLYDFELLLDLGDLLFFFMHGFL